MNIFDTLDERGFIKQVTDETEIREYLSKKGNTFYIGFDPTADSLHIGHFLQIIVIKHMQEAGLVPILLIGGGTAHIGDPSGRTDMRSMMTKDVITENGKNFAKLFEKFVDLSDGKAIIANNADWLLELNYVDFLRDIGTHFSVNKMLSAECFKSRYEKGLSFLEFNYMLMQGYDFFVLFEKYGCRLELGGDDQWSNILAGTDLIRRKTGENAYGMTFALLETKDGKKMGKTAKGALWLDENKTSVYDFFQYFRNVSDEDVEKCLKLLTFISLSEISEIMKGDINKAKEILATEVTTLVHGEEKALQALNASKALFKGEGNLENVPQTEISKSEIEGGIGLATLMTKIGLTKSNGEAMRTIEQGGVLLNGEKISDKKKIVKIDDFKDGELLIKKGKKTFHNVVFKA